MTAAEIEALVDKVYERNKTFDKQFLYLLLNLINDPRITHQECAERLLRFLQKDDVTEKVIYDRSTYRS